MKFRRLALGAAALALACTAVAARADIAYIVSWRGHMLHMSGNTAVTADWRGQPPIQGFGGYGRIQMNGRCLTGRSERQPLTWEGCGNDKAQVWKLAGGQLTNERGFCADVEGMNPGANARVIAWNCSRSPNQKFTANHAKPAQQVASRIANAAVREKFLAAARSAAPGTVISMATGQVISTGGGNVISTGGGNVISTGGGNVVAPGGGN